MKHNNTVKIKINGTITVIRLGTKNNERKNISIISMCKKFEIVISLVIWSTHAIEKKINKIRRKFLMICMIRYVFILWIFIKNIIY